MQPRRERGLTRRPEAGFQAPGERVKTFESLSSDPEAVAAQHAALCYRIAPSGHPVILLVTSRETGRWVLPKGWPKKRLSGAGTARAEAFEEAGARGEIAGDTLGIYSYRKCFGPGRDIPCVVSVHPLRVLSLADRFPEAGQRQRRWFHPEAAAHAVDEPELAQILRSFDPAMLGKRKGARAKG